MPFKVTKKMILDSYGENVFYAPYCKLRNMLHYKTPIAHNLGTVGWNYNLYDIHGTAICTGPRNMPGKEIPAEVCASFEKKACEIIGNRDIEYSERIKRVDSLLTALVFTISQF